MRISMYNELAIIGLMWSREVIYEEWHSLLSNSSIIFRQLFFCPQT